MAIILEKPPGQAFKRIETGIKPHHLFTEPSESLLLGDESVAIALPHQVFCLSATNIAGNAEDLKSAVATGWRFLVLYRDNVVAAAEISGVDPKTMRFSHVNRGPYVGSTIAALETSERFDLVKDSDFKLRLLRINSLYFVGLWLHGSHADFLVPLDPAPKGLEPNVPYAPVALFEALEPLAKEGLLSSEPILAR